MVLIDLYETKRSFYLIDLKNKCYMRLSKSLTGRESFEIANYTDHLQDDLWFDLEDIENPVQEVDVFGETCLQIRYPNSRVGILTTAIIDRGQIEMDFHGKST